MANVPASEHQLEEGSAWVLRVTLPAASIDPRASVSETIYGTHPTPYTTPYHIPGFDSHLPLRRTDLLVHMNFILA